MLDAFIVFSTGGLVLFTWRGGTQASELKGNALDLFAEAVLVGDTGNAGGGGAGGVTSEQTVRRWTPTSAQVAADCYAAKYSVDNRRGLVYVAFYQRLLVPTYADALVEAVRAGFVRACMKRTPTPRDENDAVELWRVAFDGKGCEWYQPRFEVLLEKLGARQASTGSGGGGAMANYEERREDANRMQRERGGGAEQEQEQEGERGESSISEDVRTPQRDGEAANGQDCDASAPDASALDKLKRRGRQQDERRKDANGKQNGVESPRRRARAKKAATKWDRLGGGMAGDDDDDVELDFSESSERSADAQLSGPSDLTRLGHARMDEEDEYDDDDDDDELNVSSPGTSDGAASQSKGGWLSSMMIGIVGKNELESADLAPVMEHLRQRLMSKNVAEEIASKLTASVESALVGKKLDSFTSVRSIARTALEEALVRILTPRGSIDVLSAVRSAKGRGRPFVIAFIGVNGVGKSTNLSKVAYWLLDNGIKVGIAACDTFRAGAVEQLRTHVQRLSASFPGVKLYERGYEKDPAGVASDAINQARHDGIDVVLIDTAGRMQDNEPLMRALSKLVYINTPDITLFVGEALVGNDAVDQLSKFNEKLIDLAPGSQVRTIDGILLTKFDTIDDKVGAALSMTYTSGAPILFVGSGQTYVDLKKLNVKSVVKALMK